MSRATWTSEDIWTSDEILKEQPIISKSVWLSEYVYWTFEGRFMEGNWSVLSFWLILSILNLPIRINPSNGWGLCLWHRLTKYRRFRPLESTAFGGVQSLSGIAWAQLQQVIKCYRSLGNWQNITTNRWQKESVLNDRWKTKMNETSRSTTSSAHVEPDHRWPYINSGKGDLRKLMHM